MVKSLILSFIGMFLVASGAQASGTEDPFAKNFNQQGGVAIHGYDVVSYFKGAAQQGNKKFAVEYRDVTFLFVNRADADEFDANPEKYIPAYGGWCATAIGAMNKKLDINPSSFIIQDGGLYLFSTSMGPAKEMWAKGLPGIKQKADANWAQMTSN